MPSSHLTGAHQIPPSSSTGINSLLSKVYKQAFELYLTRRLPECLALLEPSIFPWMSADGKGNDNEYPETALIGASSRRLRIKIWNLYLSLLNDIVRLDASEGRSLIGSRKWRDLTTLVQSGAIWDQVVKVGYSGVEADVDADVIVNLSTLLLTQCDTQELNQERLETYLTGSSPSPADLSQESDSSMANPARHSPQMEVAKSTQNLRDFRSRIKIFELFALHILPRTRQWKYAEDSVSTNKILDVESKELFLQIIESLQKNQGETLIDDPATLVSKEEVYEGGIMDEQPELSEIASELEYKSLQRQQRNVANDYGIEDMSISPTTDNVANDTLAETPLDLSKTDSSSRVSASLRTSVPRVKGCGNALMSKMQYLMLQVSNSISTQPILVMRFVLFVVGFMLAFSRHDVRERVKMLLNTGWQKMRRTAGMGVKVSYM